MASHLNPDADGPAGTAGFPIDLLNSDDYKILDYFLVLEKKQKSEDIATAFEVLMSRRKVENLWLYAIAAQAYAALKRDDACFMCSAIANQMDPASGAAPIVNGLMYEYFTKNRRYHEALETLRRGAKMHPGAPIGAPGDMRKLEDLCGIVRPVRQSNPESGRVHRIHDQSIRPPFKASRLYADTPRSGLRDLELPTERPAVDVHELTNATVLLLNGQVVIVDDVGNVREDISISDYAQSIFDEFNTQSAMTQGAEELQVETAVVVSDRWHPVNYAHFVLDQIPRLSLYEGFGLDFSETCIIGPKAQANFQKSIVSKLGLTNYLDVERIAKIKVGRLLVSSNCAEPKHAAHLGADWTFDFVRDKFRSEEDPSAPAEGRKIYISRSDGHGRHVANEKEIFGILQSRGFEIVYPGSISFEDQRRLFSQATHIAGPHGAAMTNSVFARKGLKIIEFFHPLFVANYFIYAMNYLEADYCAAIAKDAYSDEEKYNVPSPDSMNAAVWRHRDMHVDPNVVYDWLDHVGLK